MGALGSIYRSPETLSSMEVPENSGDTGARRAKEVSSLQAITKRVTLRVTL